MTAIDQAVRIRSFPDTKKEYALRDTGSQVPNKDQEISVLDPGYLLSFMPPQMCDSHLAHKEMSSRIS